MTTPLTEAIRVLKEAFPGVKIGGKVPNPMPPRCIRVSRVGGTRGRSVDHMSLLVECYAPNSVQAEQDALDVDNALQNSPNRSRIISDWDDATIVDYGDPDTSAAKWQVHGTLHCITF